MKSLQCWFCWCAVLVMPMVAFSGCATIREVAALRRVDFRLDRLEELQLAGISLKKIQSYEELRFSDAARVGLAIANEEMPLTFVLYLDVRNPEDNDVTARMVGMDWTLYLRDKKTVGGALDRDVILPPGEPQDVPVRVELDLMKFFNGSARDLVELALSLQTEGPPPKHVRLEVMPSINTPVGVIQYPEPIVVIGRKEPL